MGIKQVFFLFGLVILFGCSSKNKQQTNEVNKEGMLFTRNMKEYLGHPFGTLLELEGDLVSGETRHLKGDEGVLFFRVTGVAGVLLKQGIEMRFEDETKKISPEAFGLYRSSFGTDEIKDADTTNEIKKGSIGRKIKLVAYETGRFLGLPEKYTDYQPEKAAKKFNFEHSLIVVACLNCNN